MLKSIILGLFVMVFVCWAVGAYNRMVRLRAATMHAWAVLQSLRLQLGKERAESVHNEQATSSEPKIEAACRAQNGVYALAVDQYNEAIAQLPTLWLAALFGFKAIKKEVDAH